MEGISSISAKHTWIIRDPYRFSKIMLGNETFVLKSETFGNEDFKEVTWELFLEISSSSFVYLYLRQYGPNNLNKMVNTKYKLFVNKYGSQEVVISKSTNKLEHMDKLGYKELELHQWTFYGNLEIKCEVEVDVYNPVLANIQSFEKMAEMELFGDCILKVGESSVKCHKGVLSKNSQVFYNILGVIERNKSEFEITEIPINEFTLDVVHAMLQFFYMGHVKQAYMEKHAENIFVLANKYQIMGLKYDCEMFLANSIDNEKLLKYFNLIDLYGASTLEKGIISYIQANKSVLKCKEWENIKSKKKCFGL